MTHTSISALKDTGIPWLGHVPVDWTVQPIKYNSYIKARVGWKGLTSDEFETSAFAYLVTGTDFRGQFIDWKSCYQVAEERYHDDRFIQLRDGDLLITKDGTIGKVSLVSGLDKPASLNSGIFLVRPQESYSTPFLYWVLSSRVFDDYVALTSTGSTILHLYQNVFEQFSFGFPSLDAQTSIVCFLERETAQIDDLIGKQERLIELLAEKRQAVITQAVTKGQDPNAPTKPSDIPWLGDIPTHWVTSQLGKWLVRKIEGGLSPTASRHFPDDEDWGVLSLGAVGRGEFLPEKVKAVDPSEDVPSLLEIRDGDLLLTRSNVRERVGFAAVVEGSRPKTIFPDLIYRLDLSPTVDETYMACFLSSLPARGQIESSARGSSGTMPKISHDQVRSWRIPLPPIDEQHLIVDHLRITTSQIDDLIDKARSVVSILRERRAALISAAVTGKIDVSSKEFPHEHTV